MRTAAVLLWLTVAAAAQTPDPTQIASFAPLNFLLGTWSARTAAKKGDPGQVLGEYTFRTDLVHNIVTRVSATDNCVSAKALDCQHYDAFTIYRDPGDPTLHALYLDSQGHTIHYNLSFPAPNTVIFFSTGPGTQTRLSYHAMKNILSGKLQTAPPGSTNFTSTLDWFGVRVSQNESAPAEKPLAAPHALDALQDTARILFVCGPQSADPAFKQQIALMSGQEAAFAERNLILIPVLALWTPADKTLYDQNLPFSTTEEQTYARHRFKIPANPFSVVLVGKDGGEKFRSRTPLTPQKLFSTIDAMPMRREEMKKR